MVDNRRASATVGASASILARFRTTGIIVAIVMLIVAGEARAGVTNASSFTKTGTDTANGSVASATGATGTASPGDTINWVLGYRNTTGGPANVDITDPFGANQTFVSGSLKTPPGFAPAWSTDGGGSYATPEPSSGVNAIRAAGTSVPGSTGLQSLFSPPLASFAAGASQGDGWEALFVGGDIYNVHHHTFQQNSGGDTIIDCHVAATGAECPGYPATGQTVPTTAGTPLGTAQPPAQTIVTAFHNNGATYNGRIYFASAIAGTTNIGVSCVDPATNTSCGYTQLGTSADVTPAVASASSQMTGGAQIGSKYYTLGYSNGGPVYCFDMATNAPCAGWTNPSSVPGFTAGAYTAAFTLDSWGGYIFTQQAQTGGVNSSIGCVVAATGALCPGWTTPHLVTGINDTFAPITDASGTVTGICVSTTASTLVTATYQCYNINGTAIPGPAPFASVIPAGDSPGLNVTADPLLIGTRLYQPWVNSGGGGSGPQNSSVYTCWDYATNSACAGFTPVASGNTTTQAYTIRQDPNAPDCLWELGNGGTFEVFSATFGGSVGCSTGSTQVKLTPADFYCDGKTGHITGWNQLNVVGLSSSQYDAVAVTITDANGNPVPGWSNRVIPSSQVPVDISSIPYSGSTTTLNLKVVIDWGTHPVVSGASMYATYAGDPPQVCFQTTVGPAKCTADQSITNQGNAITVGSNGVSDTPDGNNTGAANFVEAADPTTAGCKADMAITKTANSASVTPGGQVIYTLIAKNNGPDTATNAEVSDAIPGGLTIVSAQPSQGTCTTAGAIDCALGTMLSGGSAQILVTANVSSGEAPGSTINNCANVSAHQDDTNPANNVSCAAIHIVPPPAPPPIDLVIVKHVNKHVVLFGQPLTYTIDVTNYGPGTAPNVHVTDTVTMGMKVLSVKPQSGTCSKLVPLTCSLGTMTAGKTIKIVVKGIPSNVGTENNTASVVAKCTGTTACPPIKRCTNGSRCVHCPRNGCPAPNLISHAKARIVRGLKLTKSVNPHVLTTGQFATYHLKVTNPNPVSLHHVKVCDTRPAGLLYVYSNPIAFTSHGQWCWKLGTLGAHKSRSITLRAESTLNAVGLLTNHAVATADGVRPAHTQATVRVINTATGCGSAFDSAAAARARKHPPAARMAC
jgi:uncharacterized repeat protein (TIGR01451 family)